LTSAQLDSVSIQDVYALVDSNSPKIRAASALASAAKFRIAPASSLPDPEVQIGFMNRKLPSLAPMEVLGMTQIQIMQMLPSPAKLRLATLSRRESAMAESERLTAVRWDTRMLAANSYYDLYAGTTQLRIAAESRKVLDDIAKLSQGMYASGEGKQADVLRAQVEVERMNAEILRMQGMVSGVAARLNALTGAPIAWSDVALILPRLPDSLPPLAVLAGEAETSRPMIAAAAREVSAAVAAEQLAKKELWPDLQVGVQLGYQRGPMGIEKMGSLMIGATVPIHAGSRQLSMRREAGAMRAMAEAEADDMRAETRARITAAYAEFESARKMIALYRSTLLPQAQASVSASMSAYRAGAVALMVVLDNQMSLNRFRQELAALEADRGKAVAEIEMLLGRSLSNLNDNPRNSR
jgi:outer membrane protein TolC